MKRGDITNMRLNAEIRTDLKYAQTEIVIPIDNKDRREAQKWLQSVEAKKGEEVTIEVKRKRKKRSLNANAYFWQLVNKVAIATNSTDQDVYRDLVHNFGVSTTLMVRPEAQEAFIQIWTEGKDSSGWFCEDLGHGVIKAYSGTSTYNTQQMARIIDGLVEECKELNIETLTPEELEHLKSTWRQ